MIDPAAGKRNRATRSAPISCSVRSAPRTPFNPHRGLPQFRMNVSGGSAISSATAAHPSHLPEIKSVTPTASLQRRWLCCRKESQPSGGNVAWVSKRCVSDRHPIDPRNCDCWRSGQSSHNCLCKKGNPRFKSVAIGGLCADMGMSPQACLAWGSPPNPGCAWAIHIHRGEVHNVT
jgi:hypothetical protein